jgi:hypothetical protein
VQRQAVNQVIQAFAYTSFLCSTYRTWLKQSLSGSPSFGSVFEIKYVCHAVMKARGSEYNYAGRYSLDFIPCPQDGRMRC